MRNRLRNKERFQLSLVLRMFYSLQNRRMCNCTNIICVSRQSHLVFILYDPAFLDSKFEEREVLLVEFEKGNMVADLICYRPDGRRGVRMCKGRGYLVCSEDLVDVVEGKSFVHREGQAGPDYRFGLDGWDEECGFVVVDVVCEIGVGQRAASQVVEESTLSGVVFISNVGSSEVGGEQDLKGWVSSLSSIIRVFCPSKYRTPLTPGFFALIHSTTRLAWALAGYLPANIALTSAIL
jgi:hypothetical protein